MKFYIRESQYSLRVNKRIFAISPLNPELGGLGGAVQVNGRKEGRKEIKWNDVDKKEEGNNHTAWRVWCVLQNRNLSEIISLLSHPLHQDKFSSQIVIMD